MINCSPFAIKTAPHVVSPAGIVTAAAALIAFTIAMSLCTSAVKVTQSMMIIGGNNILLLLPVTFKKTHNVINTNALNNWFADPNSGQIFAYPIFVKT